MNLTVLGSKLSRYREQLAMSKEEVSAATRIPLERLLSVEAGSQAPTGDEVLILADFYHCNFKFFISNEHSPLLNRPKSCIAGTALNSPRRIDDLCRNSCTSAKQKTS
ncbi:helix-turn-helix domain-containing protein [Pseudomonas sp. AM14(2022)]|uniref:helix-turn-helix domain-containing protein n=1 Tax=Pseudomonas sp. AM14(2022) TaxID=2983371 RepID=UPI002E7FC1FF|nr:helix-turn-helix transcriptional regulator [Pseudomonas sp. AM14(2022)]